MLSRKEFLKQIGVAGAGLCAFGAASLLEGCKGAYYVPHKIKLRQVVVLKSDMDLATKGYAVVRNDELMGSIYLAKKTEDEYTAVLMICTHKQCDVNPVGKILICPCHGSEFSAEGTVMQPPAEKDLFKYEVKTDEENIYIQL